jgi:CDGSH-type Zn-finger protein
VAVLPLRNGPFLMIGPLTLALPGGETKEFSEQDILVVCRCGRSAHKLFCDGTHHEIGFAAPGCDWVYGRATADDGA